MTRARCLFFCPDTGHSAQARAEFPKQTKSISCSGSYAAAVQLALANAGGKNQ
jgi:hypothetical protein